MKQGNHNNIYLIVKVFLPLFLYPRDPLACSPLEVPSLPTSTFSAWQADTLPMFLLASGSGNHGSPNDLGILEPVELAVPKVSGSRLDFVLHSVVPEMFEVAWFSPFLSQTLLSERVSALDFSFNVSVASFSTVLHPGPSSDRTKQDRDNANLHRFLSHMHKSLLHLS